MTINRDTWTIKDRLMRAALLQKAEKNKNFDSLAEFHSNYWVEQGRDYFTATNDVLESFFLPNCTF